MPIEKLVDAFVLCVQKRREVDYASRSSVWHYNRNQDRYRKIARSIIREHPNDLSAFVELLHHDEWDVRLACATCLLEELQGHDDIKRQAYSLIIDYIVTVNPWDAFGWQEYIKEWTQYSGKSQ